MSIGMDRFAAVGQFPTYEPAAATLRPIAVFSVQCRCCGYEPDNCIVPPRLCPKCHGKSWERFAKPGSILKNATRY